MQPQTYLRWVPGRLLQEASPRKTARARSTRRGTGMVGRPSIDQKPLARPHPDRAKSDLRPCDGVTKKGFLTPVVKLGKRQGVRRTFIRCNAGTAERWQVIAWGANLRKLTETHAGAAKRRHVSGAVTRDGYEPARPRGSPPRDVAAHYTCHRSAVPGRGNVAIPRAAARPQQPSGARRAAAWVSSNTR